MTDIGSVTKGQKLLRVVEKWLRDERDAYRSRVQQNPDAETCRAGAKAKSGPEMPSKHLAFFR